MHQNQNFLTYYGTTADLHASPLHLEPHIWETKLKPEVKQLLNYVARISKVTGCCGISLKAVLTLLMNYGSCNFWPHGIM